MVLNVKPLIKNISMINVTRKAAWKSGRVGTIKQLHNA
jgi:hypothetical protein